jgi:hypothetical protein
MKIKTIEVYSIDELNVVAKQKAIEYFRCNKEYFWIDEAIDTLSEFAKIFPVKIKNYELSPYSYSYIKYSLDCNDEIKCLEGIRLYKYIMNNFHRYLIKGKYFNVKTERILEHRNIKSKKLSNGKTFQAYYSRVLFDNSCVLTGVCFDDDILSPIYSYLKKIRKGITFEDLIDECIESLKDSIIKDMEFQDSDEYILEHIDANEYEFDEDGNMI